MSTFFGGRVRFVLSLIFVLSAIPWANSIALADDATPPSEPTAEVEVPTEAVDPPTVEPTAPPAVEPTVEPTAEIVSSTTPEPTATETTIPTSEPEIGAAASVFDARVSFLVCQDNERAGQTAIEVDNGDIQSASTGENCTSSLVALGSHVTVTLTNVDTAEEFDFVFDGTTLENKYNEVELGTYQLTYVSTNPGFPPNYAFPGTITLDSSDYYAQIDIQYFVTEQADPNVIPEGSVTFYGRFRACEDATRAGQTDYLVAGYFATDSADKCEYPVNSGMVSLTLEGFDYDGVAIAPITVPVSYGGSFEFGTIPNGTYQITESVHGNQSEPFVLTDDVSLTPQVLVHSFFADEAIYNSSLQLQLVVCDDADRAGEVDYLVTNVTGHIIGLSTCLQLTDYLLLPIGVTVRDSTDNIVYTGDLTEAPFYLYVPGLTPGFYTIQLDGEAESQPFELVKDHAHEARIALYVDDPEAFPDPTSIDEPELHGSLAFCTTDGPVEVVDYHIDVDFTAISTSECVSDSNAVGVMTLYRYENSGDAEPVESWVEEVDGGHFYFGDDDLKPGFYRLGFSPSSFQEPATRSDEFPMFEQGSNSANVFVYTPAPDVAMIVIQKHICYDAERGGTTEFYVHKDIDLTNIIAVDTTITCKAASVEDGDYIFTLTNVESNETTIADANFDEILEFTIGAVPSGTYTLTEKVGDVTAVSDPFVIDSSGNDYTIIVRNYLDQEFPDSEGEGGTLRLHAYDCVSDDKAGTSEFFFVPFLDSEGGASVDDASLTAAAALVENCVPAPQYAFELENDLPEGSVSAAAVYEMIPLEDDPFIHEPDFSVDFGQLPPGDYVIRETVTGSESDQIVINQQFNQAYFYRFLPAPTETPEPTLPTDPDPTATPGKVTELPSTGQGQPQTFSGPLQILLLTGMSMILLAAGVRRTSRRL